MNYPDAATRSCSTSSSELARRLRSRRDQLLGLIHAITLRRDSGEVTIQESLPEESSLVIELGQVQDRLSSLGGHAYDGCPECRPSPKTMEVHEMKGIA